MITLSRSITFKVKENPYTINFPTVSNFLDIEARRMLLSNGTYGQLLRSSLVTSSVALDMIDMVSVLSVMAPQLITDLKVASILDLDMMDSKELLDVYKSDILPWVNSWMPLFSPKKESTATEPQ